MEQNLVNQSNFQPNTSSKLIDLGFHTYGPTMQLNYRDYGDEFGVRSFAEFAALAREHLKRALDEATAGEYSLYETAAGGTALDYKFMVRAVYNRKGKPICMYKPRFLVAGYRSPEQELQDFVDTLTFKGY